MGIVGPESERDGTVLIENMRPASCAILWLLSVSASLSAAAKLYRAPLQATNMNTDMNNTGLVLYGFSPREKRSASINEIRDANHQATNWKNLKKDQELYLQQQFNAIEKVLPAPLAINLLSQIVLISAVYTDFPVICPTGGCQHLEYPDSFKSSLLQLSYGAYDAFNAAHVNMDVIDRLMRSLPGEVRFALETLLTGDDEEIELLLPDQMDELKQIAVQSRNRAQTTVDAFNVVKEILEELIKGGKATQSDSTDKVATLALEIEAAKKRKEAYEERQKELRKTKEEVKKELDEAEEKYVEALDNIPDGWDMLGLQVSESLSNTFTKLVDFIPEILGQVAKTVSVAGKVVTFVPDTVDKISGEIFGETNEAEKSDDSEEKPDAFLQFPSCNLIRAKGGRVTITEEQQVGLDFVTAVTNMQFTTEALREYIRTIFEGKDDKLSLAPGAEQKTITIKKLLKENKDHIEKTGPNSVPSAMKGNAVTFYRKIFTFLDKVLEMSKSRSALPEDYMKLEKEAKDLYNNGECFHSWLIQLLDLPPATPKLPFRQPRSEEVKEGKSISEIHQESAKRTLEGWKTQRDEKENAYNTATNNLLIVSHNLTQKITELAAFDATTATLNEVLDVLEQSLEKMSKLQAHWLEIREFFQLIENLVDTDVAAKIGRYVSLLEDGASGSLRKKSYFKNRLYEYIQEINIKGFLVHKLSTTYMGISDKYILPPVRKLGQMLESDEKKSNRLRNQIAAETKRASSEMELILKDQQRTFLDSMKKRIDELEAAYKPIMDQIPEERKKEIEEEVNIISASIPVKLIEKRTTENRQIDGIQGSLDDFLTV